jgi:ubiquinone biosynthesis protein
MAAVEPLTSSDLEFGAFNDHGPWVLDPDDIPWQWDVDRLRRGTVAELPRLLTPRKIPPITRLVRTAVALGGALLGWLLFEYRRPKSRAGISRRLRKAFEGLGSSYVKLGQILSSGEGVLPDELVGEFKLLRDRVAPEPFEEIRAVIEIDLGGTLEELFETFDETPIAAASIAQVHAARLITGEDVVVKVQRPRVSQLFRDDIAALAWLTPHLVGRIPVAALANPPAFVELFAQTVLEELDFRLEAQNMLDIASVLTQAGQRAMVVPRPHPTLVTRRVLVMERLYGFAYDDVESMHDAGIDTSALLKAGFVSSMEGAMIYGVFHGDLHGGNLLVQPDGRTALFDFGITGRLDEPRRLAFLKLLMTGPSGNMRGQIEAFRDLGALRADVDIDEMIADLNLDAPPPDMMSMSSDEMMAQMREMTTKLLGYGMRFPKELMLFMKNMMFLNSSTAILAPDIDMFSEMANVMAYFSETHGARIMADIGIDPSAVTIDTDAMKAQMGIDPDAETVTFRDMQEKRQEMMDQMRKSRRKGRSR